MRTQKSASPKERQSRKGRREPALLFSRPLLKRVKALRKDPVVKAVYGIASSMRKKRGLYLVGGAVRNLALGRALPPDYDFVYEGRVRTLAERTAVILKGSSFVLDKETLSYRVSVKGGGGGGGAGGARGAAFSVDFSPMKGKRVEGDLLARDFTVNSMAIDVESLFEEDTPAVIDPSGGMKDCGNLVLKAVSARAFDEDPVRVLRAVRLSLQYGLRIESATEALIKKKAGLLGRSSPERVKDELLLIFSTPGTSSSIKALLRLGCARAMLPEILSWPDIGGYDLLTHSLKTLDEAERLLSSVSPSRGLSAKGGRGGWGGMGGRRGTPDFKDRIYSHLSSSTGTVSNAALFKLAAFFHDIGKPLAISREGGALRFIGHDYEGSLLAKEIFARLKLSRRSSLVLTTLVKNHHRVFAMAKLPERSARAKAHLFRSIGDESSLMLLCLSLADARATRGGEDPHLFRVVNGLLDFYFNVYTRKRPKPLLNGHEIMRAFNIPEGPLVGEVIDVMGKAVEAGLVKDRRGALDYIRGWLEMRGGEGGGRGGAVERAER